MNIPTKRVPGRPAPASPERRAMNIYIRLFSIFFKIGLFTFGGGYAMIPLIEGEVVDRRRWVGREEYIDLVALAQTAPGIFAVNIAIFIGYKLRGVRGCVATALGAVMPSFLVILAIAMCFHNFRDNAVVERVFKGIRPATVALIAAPVFRMAQAAKVTWTTAWIPVAAALLIWLLGVSPVWVIIAAGTGGYLYGRWKGGRR